MKICEIFCGNSLKEDLSIDTTFDPCYFSWDSPFKETVYKLHIKYSAFTIHLPLKVQNLSKILSFEHAADLEIIALLQNKNLLMEVNACKNSNFRMVSYVL